MSVLCAPIYVVMTMRPDFLGNAVGFYGLAEADNSGTYLTPGLGAEQTRSVITSPLSLVGGAIDPVLANRLVNTLSGEDELPILEHALLRGRDGARSQGRSSIEAADLAAVCAPRDQSGNRVLALAVDDHASKIHDALTRFQGITARQFFLSLVERRDSRDLRRPQSLQELRSQVGNDGQEALMAVIEAFRAQGVGFALPAPGQPPGPGDPINISHESLMRRWCRFQTWLAEEDLDVAELKEWHQRASRGLESGGWLDENDCGRAQRWRARVRHGESPSERCQLPWEARMMEPARFRPLHAPPPHLHIDSSSLLSITDRCRQWCRPTRTPSNIDVGRGNPAHERHDLVAKGGSLSPPEAKSNLIFVSHKSADKNLAQSIVATAAIAPDFPGRRFLLELGFLAVGAPVMFDDLPRSPTLAQPIALTLDARGERRWEAMRRAQHHRLLAAGYIVESESLAGRMG